MLTGHVAQIQGLSPSLTMDNGLKILTVASVMLASLPAQAQLASQSTSFTGSVPLTCDLTSGTSSATMSASASTSIVGNTPSFYFTSNAAVKLALSPVTVNAAPTGTNSYNWQAVLFEGANSVATTDESSSSPAEVSYSSGLSSSDTFSLEMTVISSGSTMAVGTYTGTVTLDCLAP